MILVTLGTQFEQFTRLLDLLENSDIKEEIIVQAGHTKYESKKMKIFDFIPYDEMSKLIDKCSLVITHSGTGSILMPLKNDKKVIVCPRLAKYNEHVDDHQLQITEVFEEAGYVLVLHDGDDINEVYKKSITFKPNKFISNSENFINNLKKEIDN